MKHIFFLTTLVLSLNIFAHNHEDEHHVDGETQEKVAQVKEDTPAQEEVEEAYPQEESAEGNLEED